MVHVTRSSNRLFHVKQQVEWMNEVILLPYAEFPEDDVQDVLDVNPPQ